VEKAQASFSIIFMESSPDAVRQFDSRKQNDSASISEFEQAIHEAWPTDNSQSRDTALKLKLSITTLGRAVTIFTSPN